MVIIHTYIHTYEVLWCLFICGDHYLIDMHHTVFAAAQHTCIAYVLFSYLLLQISFRDDGETDKRWMVTSRSFDNLNDVSRAVADETSEKKKEGGNIFSRIFKIRTLQSPARKRTANKQKSKKKTPNRSSLGYEGLAPPNRGESSLANSLSMPDIVGELSCTSNNKL